MSNIEKKTPKVSIGMPVYNGEPFIREALDSLLAQTFTDFELIISDNASTDQTESICQEYVARDQRVRYVRQSENRGASANFQFVLDEAVGEYFMWAAADDRHDPDFLHMSEKVLSGNLGVGLVFSSMETKNLLNDNTIVFSTGFTTVRRKSLKVFFRLTQPFSSLIYGLYRVEMLRKIKLELYDYFDVYLALWFELNSNIHVIPINLYTAGTIGHRIPYSVTGKNINEKTYLKQTSDLFKKHLGFFSALSLNILNRYLIKKMTKVHNRLIKSGRR